MPPMNQMTYTVTITSIYITTITNIITAATVIIIADLSNQSNIYFPGCPQIQSSRGCPHPGQLGKSLVAIRIIGISIGISLD